MPLLSIPSGNVASATAGAYEVANSCRFDDGSSSRMTKTPGSDGNLDNWTFSCWVKRGNITTGTAQCIFSCDVDSSTNYGKLVFDTSDRIEFHNSTGGVVDKLITNRVFRDVAAWYHIVAVWDSDNGTEAQRMRLYINGVEESSFNTADYPTSGLNSAWNQDSVHSIGDINSGQYFDGYIAEAVFTDGQVYAASDFGEFDEDSPTIWKPKDVSGLTFGNNGFYLDFEDSGNLGDDESGNADDLSETNIAAVDQATDTPTNNFATLNPLYKQDHAFSEGNLEYTSTASDWDTGLSTIGVASGKWFVETKVTVIAGVTRSMFGLTDERNGNECAEDKFITSFSNGDTVGYYGGSVTKNGSDAGGTWSDVGVNEIVGMYVDLDNGYVYFSVDGTMQNSGDPTSGATGTGGISITTGQTYLFGATAYGGGASQTNFGNPVFSITSSNADPNGYGSFEYGTQNYYALCTKNLAEFG